MKKVEKLYRTTYQGEHIVTDLTLKGNNWDISKTWIGNSVTNNQISNQACIIGNGISRKEFPIDSVFNHFGGLLATQKLQTYGCNALYRDHTPDFLVVSGDNAGIVTEVANSGYCTNNIVYASAMDIQAHPGAFYLTPQDPDWNSGATATYLAAFDGHTKIFLLGFDGQDTEHYNYNMYAGTPGYQTERNSQSSPVFSDVAMKIVFDTYFDVEFVRVMPSPNAAIPAIWKNCTNLRQISFREFVLEANL